MVTFLYIIFWIFGFFAALHATTHSRTTQAAIAWSIGLVALPFITLPLYIIFGLKKFQGYRKIKKIRKLKLKKDIDNTNDNWHVKNPYQLGVVENLSNTIFTSNNDLTLLINGKMAFEEMLGCITKARKYVLIQFYITKEGELLERFILVLKKLTAANIPVYFLLDEIGSFELAGSYIKKLKEIGVRFSFFSTGFRKTNRFQINFRNHRKSIVVDGEIGFIGGLNLADEYINSQDSKIFWRDTQLKISGDAVKNIQEAFIEDWFWSTDELLELSVEKSYLAKTKTLALVLNSGPADKYESYEMCFVHLINRANSRIWMATPYFIPDGQMMTALKIARIRGVQISIIIPILSDNLFVDFARLHFLRELSNYGVDLYYYTHGFMHQKILLVDQEICSVGTANIDNRSFYLNFESTAIIYDRHFNQQIFEMLALDFQVSRKITQLELYPKGFFKKLLFGISRMFSPIL